MEEDLIFRQGCSACFVENNNAEGGMKGGGGVGDSVVLCVELKDAKSVRGKEAQVVKKVWSTVLKVHGLKVRVASEEKLCRRRGGVEYI